MRQLLRIAEPDYNPILSEWDKRELQAMGMEKPYYRPVELTPEQNHLLQTIDDPETLFQRLVDEGVVRKEEGFNDFLIIEETVKP